MRMLLQSLLRYGVLALCVVTPLCSAHGQDATAGAASWNVEKLAFVESTGTTCVPGRRSACPPGESIIYVRDSLTSRPRRLVVGTSPAWSPDGEQIAYCGADRENVLQVWIVNADGTGQQQLTHSGSEACQPAWSPNARKIAFHSAGRVFTMDPTGDNIARIAAGGYPRWSPDGTQILFSRNRLVPPVNPAGCPSCFPPMRSDLPTHESSVWVVDANGIGAREIWISDREKSVGSWFPDGKSIALVGLLPPNTLPPNVLANTLQHHAAAPIFASHNDQTILRVHLDGTNPEKYSDIRHRNFYDPVVLSPDGKELVAVEDDGLGSAVILLDLVTHRKKVLADGGSPSIVWVK